jgi:pimeloyl-ACP methyl ester carboxylesterase
MTVRAIMVLYFALTLLAVSAVGQNADEKRDLTETSWDETGFRKENTLQNDAQLNDFGIATRRVLKVTEGVPDKPARGTLQLIRVDNDALIRELKMDGTWDGVTLVLSYVVTEADWGYNGKETLRLKLVVKDKEPTRLIGKAEAMVNTANGPLASPDRDITLEESSERLPVIFLPGVAGTILTSNKFEVWPVSIVEKRADLALEPDGITPALGNSIGVGDILRRAGMNFYGTFIEALEATGYKSGTDLFAFPYDWRMSNDAHYERLDRLIDDALKGSKKKKVILTAHSMGGVIARGYIYSRADRAAKVEMLITMGTPYWGSPKVYYGVTSGYQFGNFTARQQLMKILMQNFPAAYQLLPQAPFVVDKKTGQMLDLDLTNTIRYKWFTNVEERRIAEDIYTETQTNDRVFNPGLMARAKAFYAQVGSPGRPNPLPGGVRQYAIIGTGVSTVRQFEMEDWSPSSLDSLMGWKTYLDLGDGRKVVMHPIIGDGDGTVPIWSLETAASTANYYVPHTAYASSAHGELPANPTVQAIALSIIKHKPLKPEAYPRPLYYMDIPLKRGVEVEDNTQFELHSDAHLRVTDAAGRSLGFNSRGEIDESLAGTFLAYEGVEFASVSGLSIPLKVTVDGIRTGKFTLNVKGQSGGKPSGEFMYKEVPVLAGTKTEFVFTPGATTQPPVLQVTSGGAITTVQAVVIQPWTARSKPGGGAQIVGDGNFLGNIPAVGGTVTSFKVFDNNADELPPIGLRAYKTRFVGATLKAVYYEMSVSYAADSPVVFALRSIWKKGDQIFAQQDLSVSKPANLNTSTKTYGYVIPPPGRWEPGNYTVEIEVDGRKVASAVFTVD